MKELIHTRPDVLMHDQEVKIHVKVVKYKLKLNRPKQIGKQSNEQSLVQPNKVFPSGVAILLRSDVEMKH
jgi:hypothetical protein